MIKCHLRKHLGRTVLECFNLLLLVNLMNSHCSHSHLDLEIQVNCIYYTFSFDLLHNFCL